MADRLAAYECASVPLFFPALVNTKTTQESVNSCVYWYIQGVLELQIRSFNSDGTRIVVCNSKRALAQVNTNGTLALSTAQNGVC